MTHSILVRRLAVIAAAAVRWYPGTEHHHRPGKSVPRRAPIC
jgi:hypothetical protein